MISAERKTLVLLLTIAAGVFGACINWGLPGRNVDPYLFGDRRPWTGEEILKLLPPDQDDTRGADVDANPLSGAREGIELNATDAQRAEIVRRYRLFSYQPDEMITLMSLAKMKPDQGRFDPKLYQYGGLWIYPVGAMLKAASIAHLVRLESNQAYYLDHPAEFAKFYIVMRLYVVIWGLVATCAIFWIARKLTKDLFIAFAATLCCIFMPVVVNLAHEAKPHLPGAALTLLAIIAASKFVEEGKTRSALLTGVLCGAALGMVISALLSFVLLPAMVLLRQDTARRRWTLLLAALAAGIVVYAVSNPYVILHLLSDRSVLLSNLGNSKAMYQATASSNALRDGLARLAEGTSLPLLIAGGVGAIVFWRGSNSTGRLMAIVCAPILLQFFVLAGGKPAEYARFAVLPSICLGICGVVLVSRPIGKFPRLAATILCCLSGVYAASYLWHFGQDCNTRSPRMIAAERMRTLLIQGATNVYVNAEPAPYCLPPMDLFRSRIILQGTHDSDDPSAVEIEVSDSLDGEVRRRYVQQWSRARLLPTPLSWASKAMRVRFIGFEHTASEPAKTKSTD